MTYNSHNQTTKRQFKPLRNVLILLAVILLAGAVYFFFLRGTKDTPDKSEQTSQSPQAEQTPQEPAYVAPDLQPTVTSWISQYPADYHIVVYDVQANKVIGQNDPDTSLFAASLYKIYVAYLSLLDFQTETQDPNEILIAGQTKRECVDKMIRSSDSPCGEAMMAEIGQSTLNQRVKEMGMTGTIFNGIETSAHDTARILEFIADKKDLNDENTAYLLDAMRTQPAKYKRGLQTGAPDAIWETKVGWNEDANYHDIGIMTLPDGRKFVVAILGQGSGSSTPIADFAKTIYDVLIAQ